VGGMRHFLTDLIVWLEKLAPKNEYVLFQPTSKDLLDLPSSTLVQTYKCHNALPSQVLYEQMIYPTVIKKAGVDVVLCTCNTLPLRLKIPSVVVMQSLQYFYFPEEYSWRYWAYLRAIVYLTLHKATRVIALSETSRQTIIEKTGISSKKIHVIYHSLSDDMRNNLKGTNYEQGYLLLQTMTKGRPYILSVSSFYRYKNLPKLIEAFAIIKQRYSMPHLLLLVGGDGGKTKQADLMNVASQLGIADSVVCPGVVPHLAIPAFYLNAAVAVMPSLSETFGLPVLEAMSCGCPVVTSQTGSMAEIAGDCAVLVDPYSADSIAQGIERVLMEPSLRNALITFGLGRSQAFTREAQTQGYIRAIEDAFGDRH
jgi:glycosyltransferase involved in cell wall biosynthesis